MIADLTRIVRASVPKGFKLPSYALGNFTKHILGSHASSTSLKYLAAWNLFKRWCSSCGIPDPYIADGIIIAFYLSHLITQGQRSKTGNSAVQMATSSIQYYFGLVGRTAPLDVPFVHRMKKAAARSLLSSRRSKCEPVSADDLYTLLSTHLTPNCSLSVRMHLTVFLLMFLGLLRYSDAAQILVNVEFLRFIFSTVGKLDGVLIFIPYSKTDQEWLGSWIAIGATHSNFCPVRLLSTLLTTGGYIRQPGPSLAAGPLLRATIARHNPRRYVLARVTSPVSDPIPPLSYAAFRSSILKLSSGLSVHIGLHSARKGGASRAAELGIDSRLVCGLGRWKQGTTFADSYIKMMDGNMQRYFALTRTLWSF